METQEGTHRWVRLLPLVLVSALAFAYANSFEGAFLLDDRPGILEDPLIRHPVRCLLHTTRPLTRFTFYLNHRVAGFDAPMFHAVNLLIHAAAALALLGLFRRLLRLPRFSRLYSPAQAATLAALAAALWGLHPLQTESVTYIVQRAEALAGLFLFVTLYCWARSLDSQRPSAWKAAAAAACLMGMASKPVMLVAPLAVLLLDRTVHSGTVFSALRRSWRFYLALAGTAVLPLVLMALPNESSVTTGLSPTLPSPGQYLLTQAGGVIPHYLRLVFWPTGLCLDYGWQPLESIREALVPVLCTGLLLALSLWGAMRRRVWGVCGTLFFLALAPTSSVFPVADLAVEHRLYAALAPLAALAVVLIHRLLGGERRPGAAQVPALRVVRGGVALLALAALGLLTRARNEDYRSEYTMWREIAAARPGNFRARQGCIEGLLAEGRCAEAEQQAERAIRDILADERRAGPQYRRGQRRAAFFYGPMQDALGRSLVCQGKPLPALAHYEEALRAGHGAEAHHNRALALLSLGRKTEALGDLAAAVSRQPRNGKAHCILAGLLMQDGRYAEAMRHYEASMEALPGFLPPRLGLAWLLAACPEDRLRDGTRAMQLAQDVARATQRRSARALDALAAALAEAGRAGEAESTAREALRLLESNLGETAERDPKQPEQDWTGVATGLTEVKARVRLYEAGKAYRLPQP